MKKLSDTQILDLYNSDFSKNYHLDDNNIKIWDDNFIKDYWLHFYRLIELSDNEINNIVIPRLNRDDLKVLLSTIDLDNIVFSKCTFLDGLVIEDMKMEQFSLIDCVSESNIVFISCEISFLNIKSIVLSGNLTLIDSEINTLLIDEGLFFSSVEFNNTKIIERFNINSLSIKNSLIFKKTIFNSKKESLIKSLKSIDGNLYNYENYLIIERFYNLYEKHLENKQGNNFLSSFFARTDDVGFSEFINKKLLENKFKKNRGSLIKVFTNYFSYKRQYIFKPDIRLEESLVMGLLTFHSINLKHFHFGNSNIENLKFLDCDWHITNRLIIADDQIMYGTQTEEQYRQLKRIFKKDENWHMASLAYISEMEIVLKKLGYYIDENKLRYFSKYSLEWLVFQFYKLFGSYTQNYVRPLSVFLFSTLLFFPIYYMFYEANHLGVYSYPEALEKSISNSFPFIKTTLKYQSWTLNIPYPILSCYLTYLL
ncbi:hypothetical protein HBA12_05000 [Tenacibaculum mesophilum]|uniref:hypothetical protein n=1 Tax=Tenacibaculum mesophilum TaxID=104268 RepID=UPI001431D945|nr:hypothetical protein [Tenacibaculum mesophilum]KAF9659604.1 hypothetical protein HBA12_05000 [Tenacibaculum mesophilum]